jgi:iron-sulfur cluster repair protein YtfE (RIC family)
MALSNLMQADHRRCDAAFADAEAVLREGRWADGRPLLDEFGHELERHFSAEEEILFPAFENATGMTQGPTTVMRNEHRQMRDLLAQMVSAAAAEDGEDFAGAAETLLVLMHQHNMKEEHMLYPLCNSTLDARALEPRLQQHLSSGGSPP